jgi:hypothetical protein
MKENVQFGEKKGINDALYILRKTARIKLGLGSLLQEVTTIE